MRNSEQQRPPVTGVRLPNEERQLLRLLVKQTRLTATIIICDGIRLVAQRELNGKKGRA